MSTPSDEAVPLAICSKSAWRPAIRREHAMATLAAANGHSVAFVERPLDLRALLSISGARAWWRGLRGASEPESIMPNLRIVSQATFLPGHLNGPGEATSNILLRKQLSRLPDEAAVVVNVPWQWPATTAVRGRRVFDCADDWRTLIGHRRARLTELYRQIGREADAVVVASPSLADEFPPDRTVVVRNGVSDDMLGPMTDRVAERRLVHAGTLTPRFAADLAASVLEFLPDWTLDLYGQCQYPGFQERPGRELASLLSEHASRVRWHGVVPRKALSLAIDGATVAVILNRPERSLGQDSMKLYDYAARGRPVVTTRFSPGLEVDGPPHLRIVDTAREMADAILACRAEPDGWSDDRRRWAEQQRWISRWDDWSAAIFGALR